MSCYLHGQVAAETMRAAECLTEPEGMFVIIQYARPSLSQVGGSLVLFIYLPFYFPLPQQWLCYVYVG